MERALKKMLVAVQAERQLFTARECEYIEFARAALA